MDCVSVLSGHTQDVKFVRFSTINNNLYSCSYDDTIKVWYYEGEDFTKRVCDAYKGDKPAICNQ